VLKRLLRFLVPPRRKEDKILKNENRNEGKRKENHEVHFFRPIIGDGYVRFSWNGKALDRLFREGRRNVTFTYHRNASLNIEMAYNQLMCLFFPLMHGAIEGKIYVSFQDTVDKKAAENWILLRNSNSIVLSDDCLGKNLWPKQTTPGAGIALLYGGGKDSLGALSIYSNVYLNEEISLLRVHWSKQSVTRHREIFNSQVITKLGKKFKFRYLDCSSTFHQNLVHRKYAHHVGLSFYHSCMLPYYDKYNFSIVNYSYDALEFHTSPSIGYLSLRPETARTTDSILKNIGIYSKIRNISFGIPSFLHYDIVKRIDKNNLSLIYMCEDTHSKWCYNCRKCFTFGLLGLESGIESKLIDFSYSSLFGTEGYVETAIMPLIKNLDRGYSSKLAYAAQYSSFQHVLSNIDPLELKKKGIIDESSEKTLSELCLLQSKPAPLTRKFWSAAMQFEAVDDSEELIRFMKKLGLAECDHKVIKLDINAESEYEIPSSVNHSFS